MRCRIRSHLTTASIPLVVAAALAIVVPSASAGVKSAGGVKYVSEGSTVAAKKAATITASCPKGTHVFSGGERNGGGFGSIFIRQTFPFDSGDKNKAPDDGWRVRVKNQAHKKQAVTTEAVCGHTSVSYGKRTINVAAHTGTSEEEVSCPTNGTFAFGGGIRAPKASKLFLNSEFPHPASTGAAAWGFFAGNPAASAVNATLYVACGKPAPIVVSQVKNGISVGAQGAAVAKCPSANKHIYGGGVANGVGALFAHINTDGPLPVSGHPDRAWKSSMDVLPGALGGPFQLVTYALCGPHL
jgi:hypothetical protein